METRLKPATKFRLGAVYAMTRPNDWDDEIVPVIYIGQSESRFYSFAMTDCGRIYLVGNADCFKVYRIRARDWDKFSGQFGMRESADIFEAFIPEKALAMKINDAHFPVARDLEQQPSKYDASVGWQSSYDGKTWTPGRNEDARFHRNMGTWSESEQMFITQVNGFDVTAPKMTVFEKALPFGCAAYPTWKEKLAGDEMALREGRLIPSFGGPSCTCGLGNTIEARRHYDSCFLRKDSNK